MDNIADRIARGVFQAIVSKRHQCRAGRVAPYGLQSVGGVQGAIKRLQALDYIEKNPNRVWRVVDPIFGIWLNLNRL